MCCVPVYNVGHSFELAVESDCNNKYYVLSSTNHRAVQTLHKVLNLCAFFFQLIYKLSEQIMIYCVRFRFYPPRTKENE